jgi:hypothetical protein
LCKISRFSYMFFQVKSENFFVQVHPGPGRLKIHHICRDFSSFNNGWTGVELNWIWVYWPLDNKGHQTNWGRCFDGKLPICILALCIWYMLRRISNLQIKKQSFLSANQITHLSRIFQPLDTCITCIDTLRKLKTHNIYLNWYATWKLIATTCYHLCQCNPLNGD